MSHFPQSQTVETDEIENGLSFNYTYREIARPTERELPVFRSSELGFNPVLYRSVGSTSVQSSFPSLSSSQLGKVEAVGSRKAEAISRSKTVVMEVEKDSRTTELKLVPSFVAKHTAFVVKDGATRTMGSIDDALKSLSVDVESWSAKCKLKGNLRGSSKVEIRLQLFRNSSDEVVVECAKDHGDGVEFNAFYKRLLAALGDVVLRKLEGPSAPFSSSLVPFSAPQQFEMPTAFDSLLCPPTSPEAGSLSLVLSRLLKRARSPFFDEQKNALEALMQSAQGEEFLRALEQSCPELLAAMESLLASPSDEVVRACAALLSQIFVRVSFKEKASPTLLALMLNILEGPTTYRNRNTKRQISGVLLSLRSGRPEAFSLAQSQALDKWDPNNASSVSVFA